MAGSDMRTPLSYSGLLARLLLGVAVFAILNLIVYNTSEYFEKEHLYHVQVKEVLSRPHVHTLFAGDSHVAHVLNDRLNADPNAEAYSLAVGGDSFREVYAKVRYVVQRSPHIDTLFITADPHMFGKGRLQSSNRSFADWYFLVARDWSGLQRNWASTLMNQVPLFNDDFVQYLRKVFASMTSKSHRSVSEDADNVSSWVQLTDAQRAEKARETGIGDHAGVGEFSEPFDWYKKIFALAREHNIRVIGVRYPVHPLYAAEAPPAKIAAIDRFLRDEGMTGIVDMRDAFNDPRSFDDPDHLNSQEADAFLRILDDRLKESLSARSN
jgi:hypothetical protein